MITKVENKLRLRLTQTPPLSLWQNMTVAIGIITLEYATTFNRWTKV